jgi:hypothetical protein
MVTDWTPSSSAHRIIKRILDSSFGNVIVHIRAEYDRVVGAFESGGGSWYRLHRGSIDDTTLLKRLVKAAVKKGYITKHGFPGRRV